MPEGPEVREVADGVRDALKGNVLKYIKLSSNAKHDNLDVVSDKYCPCSISEVKSFGKKILIYLENGIMIMNELRMSGFWSWKKHPKHTKFTFVIGPKSKEFYFIAIRNLGKTYVYFDEEEQRLALSKIGPDILDHAVNNNLISSKEWKERYLRMTKKRKGSKPFLICDALIEQKIFSGIGNYLRADILWKAQIAPDRPAQDLTSEEYERLRIITHDIIFQAYNSKGSTFRTYRNVEGEEGKYVFLIYMQEKDPLGNKVIKQRFKQSKWPKRTMHWVPEYQK